jgi:DNA replication factor GINS
MPHRQKAAVQQDTEESDVPDVGRAEDNSEPSAVDITQEPKIPLLPPCVLVRVLEDMESFMGIDGRIYTLSKGDILTLPERNAAVLSERNIVLNINLCK